MTDKEAKMSGGEKSGWTVWVPVVAAVITASAVVAASYIGADAKRQVEALKVENESLRSELVAAQQEMKTAHRIHSGAAVTHPAGVEELDDCGIPMRMRA